MSRLDFSFVGSMSTPLSLDPAEYKGLSVRETAVAIKSLLNSEAPGVTYFEDDIELAAAALQGADYSTNATE